MSQIYQLFLRVSCFWLLVNFIHIVLTKLFGEKYNFFLSRNGIFIKFVQIQWHTKRFNCSVNYRIRNTAVWFTFGAYFGILSMFASIIILMYTFISSFKTDSQESQILTPVVPGVNLPSSQLVPYLFTLLLSGVFHEYGHALAAAKEGVSMYGSGIFLFLIYPAAFVDLNTEALKRVDAFQRLRIFCAGIWHNFILMVFAYILWHLMPYLLFLVGFVKEQGVVVSAIESGSALDGQLFPGSKIHFIDDCPVHDKSSWGSCLQKTLQSPSNGFCLEDDVIERLRSKENCCNEELASARDLCFVNVTTEACLHAREVIEFPKCHNTCATGHCFKPHEREGHLIQVQHSSSSEKALFIGDPSHLYISLDMSDYSSKYLWSGLPNFLELFMVYIVSLSGALAIFNAVPAYYLDGEHMLSAFLEFIIGNDPHTEGYRKKIANILLIFSSILIVVNILNAFISVCMMY